MVSRHSAKFGYHRLYDSGDVIVLVVEEQDFTCSLTYAITVYC